MEKHQELEWIEAQKIVISEDLIVAAKQQLQFLAAVDRNRALYDGPALDYAIYRYKYYWLPLLAKHAESQYPEGPLLVVPFDCEWVWHCHRLNPVCYMKDCKQLYGRILDSKNVVSSVLGSSTKQTQEIWNKMYPNEPYELCLDGGCFESVIYEDRVGGASQSTNYDLVSAVKRQSPFYYQVARPWMNDDLFLQGAIERYKGFLHLIKRNKERNTNFFCVPTYDIDLIWHSHQLHPSSYCKDVQNALGKVLEHNDMDSDRTRGGRLDVGFHGTTKLWEETFGLRYWRAGAMHRGNVPILPLPVHFSPSNSGIKKSVSLTEEHQEIIQLPQKLVMEVMVEIVGVKNLPDEHKGSLFVYLRKNQSDLLFTTGRKLRILSESREKSIATFQCEPTGKLILELISHSLSISTKTKSQKILGTTMVSLQDLLNPVPKLPLENWFHLKASNDLVGTAPISLRIAMSSTAPFSAPHVLRMVQTHQLIKSNSSFFPLTEGVQRTENWMRVVDETGYEVIRVQMRDTKTSKGISKKELIGMTISGETHVLAESIGEGWSLMCSQWFFHIPRKVGEEDPVFELIGNRKVIVFRGRELEHEIKSCSSPEHEEDFMTMVEFSAESPNGRVVALVNLKSGSLKFEEQWVVLLGITSAFILSNTLKNEGLSYFTTKREKFLRDETEDDVFDKDVNMCNEQEQCHFFDEWARGGACGGCGGCHSGCGGGCGGCGGGGCRSDGGSHP